MERRNYRRVPDLHRAQGQGVQDAFERMEQRCAQDTKCALHGQQLERPSTPPSPASPRRTLVPQMLAGAEDRFGWPMVTHSAGIGVCVGCRPRRRTPHPLEVWPHRDVMVANPTHDPATPLSTAMSVY
jgi:hypothetical protein